MIWPRGTRATADNGTVTVTLPGGFIDVGGVFFAGGGEYSDRDFIEATIGRPIPAESLTPLFWLVGELAGPVSP